MARLSKLRRSLAHPYRSEAIGIVWAFLADVLDGPQGGSIICVTIQLFSSGLIERGRVIEGAQGGIP
jgi:hypothetical protein